ncbi:ephrin-A1 isoform X2 [Amia ocellicauda]|uniref:ephrin-A1 isoform X2 n=1 Tax=Amia ocellicauda TaxID=2972642 RepID=UPI0034641FFC
MDVLWMVCVAVAAGVAAAERHSVYWNSSNPKFLWDEYRVSVQLNDYLDIVCPHYAHGAVPSSEAERYALYSVERDDFLACRAGGPQELRWECDRPFAPHGPERFSEKFQRYTPFTLGKEFRPGETYYYVSKPIHHHGESCLRLQVEVVAKTDDPAVVLPDVLKSVGNSSGLRAFPLSLLPSILLSVLLLSLLL